MRTDLILMLFFFLIAVIAPFPTPTDLLAVVELEKVFRKRTYGNKRCFGKNPNQPQYLAELKLCSYIASIVSVMMNSCQHVIRQKFESLILDLDRIPEDECKTVPLTCPSTIISKAESLAIIITGLKWTYYSGFCVRVIARRYGNPQGGHKIWK